MRVLLVLLALLAPGLLAAQEKREGPDARAPARADSARFPVEVGGAWGYIDRRGEIVIAPQFDRAWPFREGRGRVQQYGRFGFVDAAGALAVPLRFDDAYEFSGGRARVVQFEAAYSEQRRKRLPAGKKLHGYVDPDGGIVAAPRYTEARDFAEGLAPVRIADGGRGLTLRLLLSPRDTWAALGLGGGQQFSGSYADVGSFSDGLAPFRSYGSIFSRARWGYLNARGARVIAARYDRAHGFSEGLACVGRDGKAGYVDPDGRAVMAGRFGDCGRFADGVAPVLDADSGLWGYIDREGQWMAEPQFRYAGEVEDGLALVQADDARFGFFVPADGFALAPVYDWARPFSAGLAYVRQGDVEGYIDRSGAFVWQKPARPAATAEVAE